MVSIPPRQAKDAFPQKTDFGHGNVHMMPNSDLSYFAVNKPHAEPVPTQADITYGKEIVVDCHIKRIDRF